MKKTWLMILFVMTLICLVGCNQDKLSDMGTLNIDIDSDVSRGLQAISMETAFYDVSVTDSSGVTVFSVSKTAQTSCKVSVPVGTYSVFVEAFNKNGDLIGLGSLTGEVHIGSNTFAVSVTELQGNGTFAMSISADEGYSMTYSIKDASDNEVKAGNLAFSDGVYAASVEIPNGFYSFSISWADDNRVLKTDTLRIIAGKAVTYTAGFSLLIDGTVSIISEIDQIPSIALTSSSDTPESGDVLTISAEISGIENYDCFWAFDGVPLSEPKGYEDFEREISDADEGEHVIALFVTDGNIIWSEKKTISVSIPRPELWTNCHDGFLNYRSDLCATLENYEKCNITSYKWIIDDYEFDPIDISDWATFYYYNEERLNLGNHIIKVVAYSSSGKTYELSQNFIVKQIYIQSPVVEYKWIEDTTTFSVELDKYIRGGLERDGITVYYTTDGAEPSMDSTVYETPFVVETGTTIRLLAVLDSDNSVRSTFTEHLPAEIPEFKRGEAGGWIVYDKGEYSDGWRYLEIAPYDLIVVDGVPCLDEDGTHGGTRFTMGYYKESDDGQILLCGTQTEIGSGLENTQNLYAAMGDAAYTSAEGSETTDQYAARLVSLLEYNGYDDWFIPSKYEWECVRTAIGVYGIGGFEDDYSYWASSEHDFRDDNNAINFNSVEPTMSHNWSQGMSANNHDRVRPMRRY